MTRALLRSAALALSLALPVQAFAAPAPFMVKDDGRGARAPSLRGELERLLKRGGMSAPSAGELELTTEDVADGGVTLVHFRQRHRGLLVLDRGASMRVDARGRAVLAAARFEPSLPSSVTPSVDMAGAASRAARILGFPIAPNAGELVIAPIVSEGGVLSWRFQPQFPGLPLAPEVWVDAQSGEVRLARNRVVFAAPTATVFASNPTKTPSVSPLPFAIPPTEARLESDRIVAKTCVDRGNVRAFPGSTSAVRVCDLVSTALPDAEGNFVAHPDDNPQSPARNEDSFAELSMYYHLSRVYSFFEGLAAPSSNKVLRARPFDAVANLRLAPGLEGGDASRIGDPAAPLAPFSNAFYSPGGDGSFASFYGVSAGGLWFGQGPRRDYAYDGDVVYHEFTHAVVDATLGLGSYTFDEQGLSAAPGAINEALADLFSSALTGDPDLGEYAASDLQDGVRYVRTLANDDRCPGQFVGEVHFDSTAFSGAMWAARVSLSPVERVVFDRTLYEAMRTHPRVSIPTWEEFIEIVLDTFERRSSLGARAIERELSERGLHPSCDRTIEASDRTVTAPTDNFGRIGYQSPGKFETGVSLSPGVVNFRTALRPGKLLVRFVANERRSQGSLLSVSGGTPFTPTVLVKFDAPLLFRGAEHDASAKVEATAGPAQYTAEVPIPEGASTAYVQIANRGDRSGIYDGIQLSVIPPAPSPTPEAAASTEVLPDRDGLDSGCGATSRAASRADTWLILVGVVFGACSRSKTRRSRS